MDEPGRTIPLTKGEFAIVSEVDYDRVSAHVWHFHSDAVPYAQRSVRLPDGKRTTILLHRFVMLAPRGLVVNHKNGNTLDCRRSNLNLVSNLENATLYKVRRGKYGYHGVNHRKPYVEEGRKNFQARALLNGKRVSLGTYVTPEEAARAYDYFMVQHYAEHAPTNFPLSDYLCPVLLRPQPTQEVPF